MRCLECLFPRIAAPLGEGCSPRSPAQASLLRSGAGALVFFLKGHPARQRWHGKALPSQTTKANSFPGKLQMKWEHWKHEGEKDVSNQLMSLESFCQFCWGAEWRRKTKMKESLPRERLHQLGWQEGTRRAMNSIHAEEVRGMSLMPKEKTSMTLIVTATHSALTGRYTTRLSRHCKLVTLFLSIGIAG